MQPQTSDPALYAKWAANGDLMGLLGEYVDDCLMGGDAAFQRQAELMLQRFQGKERVLDATDFVGVRVTTIGSPSLRLTLSQVDYVGKLKPLTGQPP